MNYKIAFFDIDGTIMDHHNMIPISTYQAINQLKKKGMKVVLATGRSPIHIKDVAELLEVDSYICFNGSIACYEGEIIYKCTINKEILKKLVNRAKKNNHPLVYLTKDGAYSNVEINKEIRESFEHLKEQIPTVKEDIWLNEEIYQVYLYCNNTEQKNYEGAHPQLRFTRWHPYTVDVNVNFMNKSVGIKSLLEDLQIAPEEAIAFGDNINDLEMISYVGTGVAMGNAVEETKKRADFITTSIYENGIFYALKKLNVI